MRLLNPQTIAVWISARSSRQPIAVRTLRARHPGLVARLKWAALKRTFLAMRLRDFLHLPFSERGLSESFDECSLLPSQLGSGHEPMKERWAPIKTILTLLCLSLVFGQQGRSPRGDVGQRSFFELEAILRDIFLAEGGRSEGSDGLLFERDGEKTSNGPTGERKNAKGQRVIENCWTESSFE